MEIIFKVKGKKKIIKCIFNGSVNKRKLISFVMLIIIRYSICYIVIFLFECNEI